MQKIEDIFHNKGISGGNELSKSSMYKVISSDPKLLLNLNTAKYAVNHTKVNWNKQAFNFANGYYNDSYITKSLRPSKKETYSILRGQSSGDITVGGFTKSQANYAIKHLK